MMHMTTKSCWMTYRMQLARATSIRCKNLFFNHFSTNQFNILAHILINVSDVIRSKSAWIKYINHYVSPAYLFLKLIYQKNQIKLFLDTNKNNVFIYFFVYNQNN